MTDSLARGEAMGALHMKTIVFCNKGGRASPHHNEIVNVLLPAVHVTPVNSLENLEREITIRLDLPKEGIVFNLSTPAAVKNFFEVMEFTDPKRKSEFITHFSLPNPDQNRGR